MDKVLAGRPPNVLKGTEVCMLLVELGQAATVVEQCVRTFKHRTPKVTIGALNIALNAVTLFG